MNAPLKTALMLGLTLVLIGGSAGTLGTYWMNAGRDAAPAPPERPLESYLPGLNLKGIDYKTEWVEYPDLVPTLKSLYEK